MPGSGSVWPGLAALLLAASTVPAMAQTTVNPGALDLLPVLPQPSRPAPARPAPHRGSHPSQAAPARPTNAQPTPSQPGAASPQAVTPAPGLSAAKPALPVVPPAIAALPPPAPVPPPRPVQTPVVPVNADAPGTAMPEAGGLRITFGAGRDDLNPTTEAALRDMARRLRGGSGGINVVAYAAGTPEDASTARRLSLQRALAARAVLINEGIASSRIYPRALGDAGGPAGSDRVDVLPQPASPANPS